LEDPQEARTVQWLEGLPFIWRTNECVPIAPMIYRWAEVIYDRTPGFGNRCFLRSWVTIEGIESSYDTLLYAAADVDGGWRRLS
jgi:hypothetical protein